MIAIASIGIVANALVLYALVAANAREAKKRVVNWLIINQNFLDLCCCVVLVITLSLRVSNIYLTGMLGYVLCGIFISANATYCVLNAAVINLMTLTVERYLKVVYPFWSKKHLKKWMIYAAIVFSWVGGILSVGPLGMATSFVFEGTCMGFKIYFDTPKIRKGYGIWNFFSFSLIPLLIFVYCYAHIVVVMRKQMRVMAGHNMEGSAQRASHSQAQSKRVKWNVIKTMIIVSAFFVSCWYPMNLYIIVMEDPLLTSERTIGYIATVFLPYINISVNPFIYGTKHEGVRRILADMMICYKRDNATVSNSRGPFPGSSSGSTGDSIKNKNKSTAVHK